MRFIHLTGFVKEPSTSEVPYSFRADDIVIVVKATAQLQENFSRQFGTVIKLRGDEETYLVTEDYSTVLRLINNANNDTDEDHR